MENILIFIAGVVLGILLRQSFIRKSNLVGNLKVVQDEEEPNPYLFLELMGTPDNLQNGTEVVLKVVKKRSHK